MSQPITIKAFADLVFLMREAQRAYFKQRTKENLLAAKNFEYVVDTQVEKMKSNNQTTLF